MNSDHVKALADAHWEYVEKLIEAHGADQATREVAGFHYKSAFIHGYKHGIEDIKKKRRRPGGGF